MGTLTIKPRSDWEVAGYTVAEHTTSPVVDLDRLQYVVVHGPGTDWPDLDFDNDGDVDVDDDRTIIRAIQRSYADSPARGYSIGYSWVVGRSAVWEARGWTYRTAANAVPTQYERDGDGQPTDENAQAVTILVIVDLDDEASEWQLAQVRDLTAYVRHVADRPLPQILHQDLESTSCPGTGMTRQHRAGLMEPTPTPTPTPTPGGNPVHRFIYRDTRFHDQFLVVGADVIELTPNIASAELAAGTPKIEDRHDVFLGWVLRKLGRELSTLKGV